MERKIRGKFIFFSSLSVLTMILIVVGLTIFIGYFTTYSKIYSDLDYVCENYEKFNADDSVIAEWGEEMSLPVLQYEFRYFIMKIDGTEIEAVDISHISVVNYEDASQLCERVLKNKAGKKVLKGTIDHDHCSYAYRIIREENGASTIVFLDCTRTIDNVQRITRLSVLIGFISFFFFFLILSAFSGRAVKSTIKNIEAQNAFITNAGHELKTPLAIISANTEVVEMLNGKNEWTEGILTQVKRMNDLIGELIFLAKMNEKTDIVLQNMDFSSITKEVTESFKAVLEQQGKQLEMDILENVEVKGEEKLLHELVSILVDNAVKYCDEGGNVSVSLKHRSRETGARLVVKNTYAEGQNVDYSRFFQRFYREDTSHNSKKKGYGIGLSMAEGIVRRLRGKIAVSYHNGEIAFTVIL